MHWPPRECQPRSHSPRVTVAGVQSQRPSVRIQITSISRYGLGCRVFPHQEGPRNESSQGGTSYIKDPGDLRLGEGQLLVQSRGAVMGLGGWCVVTTGSWPKGSLSTLPSNSGKADRPQAGSLQRKPELWVGQGEREGPEARGVQRVYDDYPGAGAKKSQREGNYGGRSDGPGRTGQP